MDDKLQKSISNEIIKTSNKYELKKGLSSLQTIPEDKLLSDEKDKQEKLKERISLIIDTYIFD